jgi:transposase
MTRHTVFSAKEDAVGRAITVKPHLTVDELQERHRKDRDPVAVRQFQVVWLAAKGLPSKAIVEATGYRRDWVFQIIKRYNEGGPDALGDKRQNNGGNGRILDDAMVAKLAARLEHPPPDGGLWTSPKVAAWVNETFDLDIDFKLAWDYLQRMGFVLKRPRPSHALADKKAQEAFKKGGSNVLFETSWREETAPESRSGRRTKPESA